MNILSLVTLFPLLGVVALAFMPKTNTHQIKIVALGISIITMLLSFVMALKYRSPASGFAYVTSHPWVSSFHINYALGIDGLALVLILLTTVLVPIVVLGGWNESEGGRWSVKTFYMLILVLETFMIGVFAATDVFLFYVIFEAMLVPVYFLIGGFGTGERAAAALKFLLYSLFGGLLMLAAVIGIYIISAEQAIGSFDVTALSHLTIDHATQNWLFLGFFIAFAIKAPLWPFHTWLPGAAMAATPGTSILLLGVLDKVGTYGMIRFCLTLFPGATKTFAPYIIVLSVISVIYGAFLAIGQKNLNSLIAFTSISHFGFITLGIFAYTSQGLTGATFYMVNHGFSTAALFLVGGWMISRRKSAAIEALALPGLSSFVSEFLVLLGTFTRYPVAAIIGTLGIVLAALYILILVQRTLHGPLKSGNESMTDLNLREKIAIAPVIAALVILGFYPKPSLHVINPSTTSVMAQMNVIDPHVLAGK